MHVGNVGAAAAPAEEVVVCVREPTADEISALAEPFDKLQPKLRYRGKFAIKFFREWLDKLAEEYEKRARGTFGQAVLEGSVRRAEFVLSNFASKSRIPTGLAAFVEAIA